MDHFSQDLLQFENVTKMTKLDLFYCAISVCLRTEFNVMTVEIEQGFEFPQNSSKSANFKLSAIFCTDQYEEILVGIEGASSAQVRQFITPCWISFAKVDII